MPFWTLFWVIIPPIVLIALAIVFYVLSGKPEQ
jgi:hypothetical protein